MRISVTNFLGLSVVVWFGCAGPAKKNTTTSKTMPTPAIAVGSCGSPSDDGVVSPSGKTAKIERVDRDLNDDGQVELVAVDRAMCDRSGNCHWNVFQAASGDACQKYIGTISGVALQVISDEKAGDQGYRSLRAFWQLSEGRMLVQSYAFRAGGYRLVEAQLCARNGDSTLRCTDESTK
jgi:hypothetical protein